VGREGTADDATLVFSAEATDESRACAAQLRRLGLDVPDSIRVPASAVESLRTRAAAPERRADWLLGDLAETTFASAEGLERLVERALRDDRWRGETSERIATRVRERLTDDVLVRRVLDLVRSSLGAPP
jgi:hypothetical protein